MKRKVASGLLVLSVVAIAVATLTPVGGRGGSGGGPLICIMCGDRGLSDFISNVVLFTPFGFAIGLRGHRWWQALLAGFLFTVTIEALQLDIIPGRDSNVGDVLANTLGALSGFGAGTSLDWWRPRRQAGRAFAMAAGALGLLLAGLSTLTPAPPATTYYLQWTPDLGRMAQYDGRVLETRIGPLPLSGPPWRLSSSDSVRTLLNRVPLQVRFETGTTRRRLAPIVSIYDDEETEVMLLGDDRGDLVYRYRLRSDALHLDDSDLRVTGFFEGYSPGEVVMLEADVRQDGYCFRTAEREDCGPGYTVGDIWSLLLFPDEWGNGTRRAMSIVALVLLFAPVGFLAVRPSTAAVIAAAALVTLIAGPMMLGFASTPWWQIVSAWAGLALGQQAARRVERMATEPAGA